MSKKKKTIFVTITLILFVVFAVFFIRGKYEWLIWLDNADACDATIESDNSDVIEINSVKYNDEMNYYYVELNPLKSGDVTFTIHSSNPDINNKKYDFTVLPFNIVVQKGKIGSIGNVEGVRIEILVLFILSGINIAISLRKLIREDRYSYTIMYYIGALLFILVSVVIFIYHIAVNNLMDDKLSFLLMDVVNTSTYFIFLLFPLIIVLAIFLAISNAVLLIKEGGGIRNFLGIGLAGFLIVATIGYNYLTVLFEGNRTIFALDIVLGGLLTYFECVMVGTVIASIVAQKHVPRRVMDYIIILGCGLKEDGTPIPLLQGRIDRAIWFAKRQLKKKDKDIVFVCSGGQGEDEIISEAKSMKNSLVSQGISEDKILLEDDSTSTYENMKFSKEVIDENIKNSESGKGDIEKKPAVAFSTTSYHVFRSGNIAGRVGLDAEGIGSKTKWYFYTNALVREFAANIRNQSGKHISNALIIFAICIIVSALYFMS